MAQARAHGGFRVWVPAFVLGLFALVILGRLVQLQIIEHPRYARAARSELIGSETIFERRGSILDRNGNVLATSVDTWDIYVNSRVWKNDATANDASAKLGPALNMEATQLVSTVRQSEAVDVLVKRDVSYEIGEHIIEEKIPGAVLVPNAKRVNPEGDVAATILGLTGTDNTGLAGIESAYNEALQGKPGKTIYERDSIGDPIPFGQYIAEPPQPGQDLVLTIDRYLQQMAEERLDAAIEEHHAQGGDIIVLDPQTGEILAAATRPGLKYSTLDLNDPKQMELLKNPAFNDVYEPGSVMKIITASAAIDQGVVTPDTTYVDTGVVNIYGVQIRNWDFQVYGEQTMTGVLQNSINTGAVFMVEKLGAETFHRYLDAFGFGKPTGVDFPGEAEGIVRRPWDKDWSPVDLATQSFGQSISVTPIQMLSAIAAAINGGNLMRPHLVKARINTDGSRTDVKPQIQSRAISAETSAKIRTMLGSVVSMDPPGVGRNPSEYTAGGKSGTANVPVPNGYNDTQVASFVGFAPLENPRILVLVKLDRNADLMTGTQAAGPIFREFVEDALHYLNVKPDKGGQP